MTLPMSVQLPHKPVGSPFELPTTSMADFVENARCNLCRGAFLELIGLKSGGTGVVPIPIEVDSIEGERKWTL